MKKILRIKIVGQSGSGLLTVGELFSEALLQAGYFCQSDREYPSVIKGGHSCYTVNFSDTSIRSLSQNADILVAIDKHSLIAYAQTLVTKGCFIHGYERTHGIRDILETFEKNEVQVLHLPIRKTAQSLGGNEQMANIITLGMLWKVLGFPLEHLSPLVEKKFQKKEKIRSLVLKCLEAGYAGISAQFKYPLRKTLSNHIRIDGNHALALGAIHCGVRFYTAYPMSPASSILSHLAIDGPKVGMIVKQAEDEITAAQMALGAMTVGTRAFTATAGGGFDLMTETLSLAGIIESPFVIVIAQRPGPGTGLPTWTAQGDLNLALHAGHGEFPRIIIGISDPQDAFTIIQEAFNKAEVFQVPVLVLTEKIICESKFTIPRFTESTIPITRGLIDTSKFETLKSNDRYAITDSGISFRWLPGQNDTHYFANGDEHDERGALNEEASAGDMYEKRMKKLESIKKSLPEPIVYGKKSADISFIGWGSSRSIMLDIIDKYAVQNIAVNYLHYEYVWPLKIERAKTFFEENANIHFLENNYTGQFANLLESQIFQKAKGRLLKWNGRPFFREDLEHYIHQNLYK